MIDQNVGKLTKLLRLLGFDSVFFTGENDTQLVDAALSQHRIILTRDTHIPERRLVTTGQVKTILVKTDKPQEQIVQLVNELSLQDQLVPFSLCLECNRPLDTIGREQVKHQVPPYVYQTQLEFVACPQCQRIYWKGTHWKAMVRRLNKIAGISKKEEG